jgi:hypothetical protein
VNTAIGVRAVILPILTVGFYCLSFPVSFPAPLSDPVARGFNGLFLVFTAEISLLAISRTTALRFLRLSRRACFFLSSLEMFISTGFARSLFARSFGWIISELGGCITILSLRLPEPYGRTHPISQTVQWEEIAGEKPPCVPCIGEIHCCGSSVGEHIIGKGRVNFSK